MGAADARWTCLWLALTAAAAAGPAAPSPVAAGPAAPSPVVAGPAAADLAPDRPLCAPDAGDRCINDEDDPNDNQYFFTVNGRSHVVKFLEPSHYKINCDAAQLDDVAMPRLPRHMKFWLVELEGCAPPATSYAAALRALNVTAARRLALVALPGERLFGAAFAGLTTLRELELDADPDPDAPLRLDIDALVALAGLRSLTLRGVRPARLPTNITELLLHYTGIEELPPGSITSIVKLEIWEEGLTSISVEVPRLEILSVSAPLRALPAAPALRALHASRWAERAPAPLACPRLRNLTLLFADAAALPTGFVAACGVLEALTLQYLPNLLELPAGLLRNATNLRTFTLSQCGITSIPPDLFHYSPSLSSVTLSELQLQSLPEGIFLPAAGALREVSLQGNRLSARALAALAPLARLRNLDVAANPLGDLCLDSSLPVLYELEELSLSKTQQTRICAGWLRESRALRRLDLKRNRVHALACADLRVQRSIDIHLQHNPLKSINCSEEDYDAMNKATSSECVTLKLGREPLLRCDCGAYWLARALALDARAPFVISPAPICDSAASAVSEEIILENTPLNSVSLSALTCALPAEHCAAGCACERTEQPLGLRVACAGPELPLPQLQRAAHAAHLPLLALRARGLRQLPERLPADLQLLDLHGGNLSHASPAAAEALFEGARRVRVSRNPLRCHCDNWPLLATLSAHRASVDEYENTTCADGRPLRAALRALRCDDGGYAWLSLALVGGLALAGALAAAALARPETRLRLKALLHARGLRVRWLTRRLDPPDADRPFDAFVSHADDDARFVYERLAPRLEPARRLCLAERDWPAGAWIPAQIEESVRRARRTVCVVSPRSLRAQWARAELRAAHAHALRDSTPRLVLLLLDVSAAELRAEPELRAALDAHAHVRWGEPCFWEKLAYALPDPRPLDRVSHAPPAA